MNITKEEKLKIVLYQMLKEEGRNDLANAIEEARFELQPALRGWTKLNLNILVPHSVFQGIRRNLDVNEGLIASLIAQTGANILDVNLKLDFDTVTSRMILVQPFESPWKEINEILNDLLDTLKTAPEGHKVNQVGVSARKVIEILADEVFDAKKHGLNSGRKLGKENYKNRILAFCEHYFEDLGTEEIDYFESMVELTDRVVTLANKATHHRNGNGDLALVAVLSVNSLVTMVSGLANSK